MPNDGNTRGTGDKQERRRGVERPRNTTKGKYANRREERNKNKKHRDRRNTKGTAGGEGKGHPGRDMQTQGV